MKLPTRLLAVALLAVALSGCSQNQVAVVSGNVSFKGKPVTSGAITFFANGEAVASSSILPDGRFVTEGVPYGEVTATVSGGGKVDIMKGPSQGKGPMSPTAAPPAKKAGGAATPRPDSAIPEPEPSAETPAKYKNVATSTLKYDIDAATKSITITLD